MSWLRQDFPHTRNTDSDLTQIIQMYYMLRDLPRQWQEYQTTVNGTIQEFTESITKDFTDLKNYVDSYFNNLDVQAEINAKIDSMVADGTFQKIVEQYLTEYTEEVAKVNENYNTLKGNLGNLEGYNYTSDVISGHTWSKTGATNTVDTATILSDTDVDNLNMQINSESGVNFANNSSNIVVEGCTINSVNSGLRIQGVTTKDTILTQNNVIADKYGFLLNNSNSEDTLITDNNITVNGGDNIELNSPSNVTTNFIIANNFMHDTGTVAQSSAGFGVGISNSQQGVIEGNIFDNNALQGIHVENSAEDIMVNGNVITSPRQRGIFDISSNRRNVYANNIISNGTADTVQAGIYFNGFTGTTVEQIMLFNNVVRNCTTGISMSNAISSPQIGTNVITGCTNAGTVAGSVDRVVTINCTNALTINNVTVMREFDVYGMETAYQVGTNLMVATIGRFRHEFSRSITNDVWYINECTFGKCTIIVNDNSWYSHYTIDNGTLSAKIGVGNYIVTYSADTGIGIRAVNATRTPMITLVYTDAVITKPAA